MLEDFIKNNSGSHFRFNGMALHYYQDDWYVIPVGEPMMNKVYCGKSIVDALEAMKYAKDRKTVPAK